MNGGTPRSLLLQALEEHLRETVQDELSGFAAYQNRVAANVLSILRREETLGPEIEALDEGFARRRAMVADHRLMPALARALRDGTQQADTELLDYLRQRTLLQMAIDNPRYAGYRTARARWHKENS